MQKLKVYLNTSVISHLLQEDIPEKMTDTLQLRKLFRKSIYDIYSSTVSVRRNICLSRPQKETVTRIYGTNFFYNA